MVKMKKFFQKISNAPISVKAGFWFTICSLMQKAINLITVPIFTRMMSAEDYGVYTIFTSWEGVLSIFATLNLSYYVFNKGMIKYKDDRDDFVHSLQALGSLACILLFVIYLTGARFFNRYLNLTTGIMCLMFIIFFFQPATFYWSARERFEYKYKRLVVVTLLLTVLHPVFGIVFVSIAENKVLAYIFSLTLVTSGFGAYFYFIHIKHSSHKNITKYWRYALCYNIPLIPHFLTSIVLSNADRIMIGDMCGSSYAAIYGVAYSASMIMVLFNNAIHQALLPWLYEKMNKEDYDGVSQVITILLVFVGAINIILISLAPEILGIMAPSEYFQARWIVPPVAASVYFMFLYNMFANVEMYYEESKLITIASVGLALLNVILNYIFINLYGFLAAGYTTLFCYAAYACVHFLMMRVVSKKNHFNYRKAFDLPGIFVLSALFVAVCTVMLTLYDLFWLRICVFASIIVFLFIRRNTIKDNLLKIKRKKDLNG